MSCFMTGGYGGTSMDDIVKASGVSKGGIYWHFKSKEEIFLYLVEKGLDRNQKEFATLLEKKGTAMNQLHEFLEWYVHEAMTSSLHTLVAEFMTRVKNEEVLDRLSQILVKKHTNNDMVCDILRKGIKKGEFSNIDTHTMAEFFCSACDGALLRFCIFHGDNELLKKTLAMAEEIFLKCITQTVCSVEG